MTPRAAGEGAWGALLGVAFFLAVFGGSILDPTRIGWLLHGDPAQHYLGFAFYRFGPWGWPLGAIANFGVPQKTSLVFTDAIPLLGIPFKLFSPWLPTDFQYLGLWMLACYALHGVFAQRVLGRLGVVGFAGTAGVLLLLTSPALALRAYGHESLMAHWLLLASFDAYLAGTPRRQAPLLVVGALVHAYWLPLLAPFVALAWWRQKVSWRHALGAVLAVALAMAAAGYFIAQPAQLAAIGYGRYSANLLTFLDPMDWRAFLQHFQRPVDGAAEWSRLLPALGHADTDQYEGFAYLGAGVLGLLLLAMLAAAAPAASGRSGRRAWSVTGPRRAHAPTAFRVPEAPRVQTWARLRALLVVAALMFCFALSARISIGPHLVTDPALPPALFKALSVFRATGRFVWPLALLLPLWACGRLAERLTGRTLVVVLASALALQAWDLSAKWAEFGRRFAPGGLGAVPDFSAPAWAAAARARHLVVLPAAGADDWIAPALFAARHRQSVNVGLLSRSDEALARRAEASARDALLAGQPAADTAYWVRDPSLAARLPDGLDAVMQRLPLEGGAMLVPR